MFNPVHGALLHNCNSACPYFNPVPDHLEQQVHRMPGHVCTSVCGGPRIAVANPPHGIPGHICMMTGCRLQLVPQPFPNNPFFPPMGNDGGG